MPLTLPRVQDPPTDRALQLIGQRLDVPVPQARVYNDANINVANATLFGLTFNSERWDEGNLHSTTTNTGRLTAPVAGLYNIGVCVRWAGNATGVRYVALRLNATTVIAEQAFQAPPATDEATNCLSTEYRLAATDFVDVLVFQRSGGALDVQVSANRSPEFWMSRKAGFTTDTLG